VIDAATKQEFFSIVKTNLTRSILKAKYFDTFLQKLFDVNTNIDKTKCPQQKDLDENLSNYVENKNILRFLVENCGHEKIMNLFKYFIGYFTIRVFGYFTILLG
jgi:hypothetical protein